MKVVVFILILLNSLFFASDSYAGSQSGKVIRFYVRADNLHWFTLSNTHNSPPACATKPQWVIKDENSVAGKTQISILLAAWASGKTIFVTGSNSCSRWGDMEDVYIIRVEQE